MEYSIANDAAYCFVCLLFPHGVDRECREVAWTINGVRQWHKMKSRGKEKIGKLSEHFSSKSHKASLHDYCSFVNKSMHVDLSKEKLVAQMQQERDLEHNRSVVKILLDVARTLGRQGLAFCGSGSDKDGNFRQIVLLMARHNTLLQNWLDSARLRPYHVTYLSPQSQNEFLTLLGQQIRDEL